MPNMSYCRFANTLEDLLDCHNHMDDEVIGAEKAARDRLIKLCRQIADDYAED